MTLPEPAFFDAIYDSPWHHPLLCWAATPFLLWVLWRARPSADAAPDAKLLWRLALLGQLILVADALFTGAWSPLAANSLLGGTVGLLFVVLGDWRYFMLLERFAPSSVPGAPARFAARAFALSWLVPWLSGVIGAAAPTLYTDPRWKFLIYETLFLGLLAWLRLVRLPRRLAALAPGAEAAAVQRWLYRLTGFEAVQYALWVLADVLILSGVRAGLLLRLVPNLLYYIVFIPLAYFTAPPFLRRSTRAA